MCHITFISDTKRENMWNFYEIMRDSSDINKNGFGVFNNKDIYRNPKQFDYTHIENLNRFENNGFLIGHTRFATHGDIKKRNTHPFETENFVFVHNGIIYNWFELDNSVLVDSEVIGRLAEKNLLECNVEEALKKTFEKMTGSFSVFIYHKGTHRLFYIRHSACFNFVKLRLKNKGNFKECLYGTTSYSYIDDAIEKKDYFNKICEIKIKDDILYRIKNNKIASVCKCKIKKSLWYSAGFSRGMNRLWNERRWDDKTNFADDFCVINEYSTFRSKKDLTNSVSTLLSQYYSVDIEKTKIYEFGENMFAVATGVIQDSVWNDFQIRAEHMSIDNLTLLHELIMNRAYERVYNSFSSIEKPFTTNNGGGSC